MGIDTDCPGHISCIDVFGNACSHGVSPPLEGKAHVVGALSNVSTVLCVHAQNIISIVLCYRESAVAAWQWKLLDAVTNHPYLHYRCHVLTEHAVIIEGFDHLGSSHIDPVLVCLLTGCREKIKARPGGSHYWAPLLGDLAQQEMDEILKAVKAIDNIPDIPDLGDDLCLVRTVLVGFVLEDAHVTMLRLRQS